MHKLTTLHLTSDYLMLCVHRVAGNAAYILGTVAENELGCYRIIAMTAACAPKCNTILVDLTNMLAFDDSESMMNAAGTIGTLVRCHSNGSRYRGNTGMLSYTKF